LIMQSGVAAVTLSMADLEKFVDVYRTLSSRSTERGIRISKRSLTGDVTGLILHVQGS